MKINVFSLNIALLSLISVPAFAADLPSKKSAAEAPVVAKTANDWNGFYIGALAGYGWSDVTTGDIAISELGTGPGIKYSPKGFSGGVEAGYNYQINNIVFGVEVDGSLGSITGKLSNPVDVGAGNNFSVSTTSNWVASARGRLGFTFDRVLVFATGGIAGTGLKTSVTDIYDLGAEVYTPSVNETRTGWVIGGGSEVKLDSNWSLKAEYLYYDFGSKTESFYESAPRTISTSGKYTMQQARIGINYKF